VGAGLLPAQVASGVQPERQWLSPKENKKNATSQVTKPVMLHF